MIKSVYMEIRKIANERLRILQANRTINQDEERDDRLPYMHIDALKLQVKNRSELRVTKTEGRERRRSAITRLRKMLLTPYKAWPWTNLAGEICETW